MRKPPSWYIDTLNARGGLAFASWRANDLERGNTLSDRPVFYFAPPTFTPTPIASPATALGGERHGFQLGLLDQQGEVPFGTLSEITEFVKRVYLGSGRSDGTDGGGIIPLPPTEPLEPSPEIGEEFERQPALNVTDFVSLVRETPRGASQSFDWLPKNKGEDQRFGLTISAILRGAEAALAEMLARLPAAKGGAFDRWHVAASRLAAILIQFDLIEAIDRNIDHRTRAACENFAQAMDANFGISAHPAELRAYPFYCIAMMICGIYPGYRWPDYPVWTHSLTSVGEPLEDLACLPISAKHAGAIGAPDPSAASIADLFCSVLASPQRIYNMPDIEDIFWFGAARVVGCDPPSISSYSPRRRIDLVHDSRLRRLTIAARLWVRKELPSRCFSPTVEKLIEDNPSAP